MSHVNVNVLSSYVQSELKYNQPATVEPNRRTRAHTAQSICALTSDHCGVWDCGFWGSLALG